MVEAEETVALLDAQEDKALLVHPEHWILLASNAATVMNEVLRAAYKVLISAAEHTEGKPYYLIVLAYPIYSTLASFLLASAQLWTNALQITRTRRSLLPSAPRVLHAPAMIYHCVRASEPRELK